MWRCRKCYYFARSKEGVGLSSPKKVARSGTRRADSSEKLLGFLKMAFALSACSNILTAGVWRWSEDPWSDEQPGQGKRKTFHFFKTSPWHLYVQILPCNPAMSWAFNWHSLIKKRRTRGIYALHLKRIFRNEGQIRPMAVKAIQMPFDEMLTGCTCVTYFTTIMTVKHRWTAFIITIVLTLSME